MIIHRIPLEGAALIRVEPFEDRRGVFARFFCSRELAPIFGDRSLVNVNFSRTVREGAVRGMHFQRPPHEEMKLVRCIRGAVYDVAVDLRRDSPTFLHWHGEILTDRNLSMLCVPEGFAHGYQTLEADSEVLYCTTAFYAPESEGGIRFDDPSVGIRWPLAVTELSEKDASLPLLGENPDPLRKK